MIVDDKNRTLDNIAKKDTSKIEKKITSNRAMIPAVEKRKHSSGATRAAAFRVAKKRRLEREE